MFPSNFMLAQKFFFARLGYEVGLRSQQGMVGMEEQTAYLACERAASSGNVQCVSCMHETSSGIDRSVGKMK